MDDTTNSYSISKIKKLIGLNHDMINFKVQFDIKSDDGSSFQMLVLDQNSMDNVDISSMEYKNVEGSISGEVIANKNVRQNYYIVLRSDVPTSVNVRLQTTQLPDVIEAEKPKAAVESTSESNFNMAYIFLAIIGIIVLYVLLSTSDKSPKTGMHQSLLSKLRKLQIE